MTLPGYRPYRLSSSPQRGIGIAALVLGSIAIPALLLCGAGLVVALAGVLVGVVAIVKGNGRVYAGVGIGLSVLTLIIGGLAVGWFLARARECGDTTKYPDNTSRERCIERKFPFVSTPTPGS